MKTTVPVLITSGRLDPVTPPENGDTLARTLSRSLHVRVPSGGHSPYGLTGVDCLDDLKRAFIERATRTASTPRASPASAGLDLSPRNHLNAAPRCGIG